MRRWHLQSRLRREPGRHDSDRCVLVVEQLEAREVLSPVVIAPTFLTPQPPENVSYTFSGSSAFLASDTADSGQNYEADLTAANGTISVTPITGLTVTNNGTVAVTVVGQLNAINILLSSGVTYQSIAFYSGDAAVTVSVTDLSSSGPPGRGTVPVKVTPVASGVTLNVSGGGEVFASASGYMFPPGFVSVGQWPDADGSETVTVTLSIAAPSGVGAFTLSAGGVPLTPSGSGGWQVGATNRAALNAILDSLVLTPPAGFSGRVTLLISAEITDRARYSDGATATATHTFPRTTDIRPQDWTGSGPGTTSVAPAAGPATTASFSYNNGLSPGQGPADSQWTFRTTAAASGTVSFDWRYDFFHAFFMVRARFELVDFTTGAAVTLTDFFNAGNTGPRTLSGDRCCRR